MSAFEGLAGPDPAIPRRGRRAACDPRRCGGVTLLSFAFVLATDHVIAAVPDGGMENAARTLAALVVEATERNPEIAAAARRAEAAKAIIPQARTPPDPKLLFSYEDMEVRETMYGASQEIPFPGKLRLRAEIAERESAAMDQEFSATRLAVVARLKEAYYEHLLARQAAVIVDNNRRLLAQFAEAASAGYAVGKMAQADVFRAQAEMSRSLGRLAAFRQRERSSVAELARILNRSLTEPLEIAGRLEAVPTRLKPEEILALVERSPMLLSRVSAVERGDATVALARREYWPDLEIGLQGVRDEPMGDSGYQVMLNVSVPLYFATKQRYAVREANATRDSAFGDLQATRQELVMRVRDALAQVERAVELIRLLREAIIPQAQLALESARSGYAVGRVDFLTLLSNLLTLQENELELQMEIAEHEMGRARLEEVIGEEP